MKAECLARGGSPKILWGYGWCRNAAEPGNMQGDDLSYDEITRLASEAKPFLAVLDPDDNNFLHRGDMPDRIRKYCKDTNQAVPQTKGEIIRVALEGIALKYRWVLERLEELSGKRLDPIHIIGGGTKNRLLNQFAADCTGRDVITGPVEATAIGNVLMQAIALGHLVHSMMPALLCAHRLSLKLTIPPAKTAGMKPTQSY